jgi:hypothetical protein
MPHIKPHVLHPQHGTGYHASFLGIADGAIVANDLVVPSGYSGDRIKWRKADANVAARRQGAMAVADHAAADGGTVRIVSHKLITSVDTDTATVGNPVYLKDDEGEWSIAAGTGSVIVGTILSAHASTGAVLLAPAHSVGVFV